MLPKGYKIVVDWLEEVAEKDKEGPEGYANEVMEVFEEDDSEDEGGPRTWNAGEAGAEGEKLDSGKPAWEVEGEGEAGVGEKGDGEGEGEGDDVVATS